MGLDMYALMSKERPEAVIDLRIHEAVRLHYWRKHPNLHGWMERLYRAKGGKNPNFNCVGIKLTATDLDQLEQAIRDNALPKTTGSFFGVSDGSEKAGDLAFVAKARKALSTGHTVIYDSCW